MIAVAFFYSPTMDSIPSSRFGPSNIKLAMNSITEMFERKSNRNDNKYDGHKGKQQIDHNHIMSKFYETEMPELTNASIDDLEDHHKAFDSSLYESDTVEINTTSTSLPQTKNRRRDLKRDPRDKAKEKLWESIEQEVSSQADDSSSDDDEH